MTRATSSLEPEYFENMFRGTEDPWELETSAYERGKYADTVGALGTRFYDRMFEIGCAKGVLTAQLAAHCRSALAIDVSPTAVAAARKRNARLSHVSFEVMHFPRKTPSDLFDLLVLSEVAYYWDDADIERAARWIGSHLEQGGDILLVHWTGETDYPQSGDQAVSKIQAALDFGFSTVRTEKRQRYRLDLWRRA